ncbi:MAG TPA: DUF1569 domain-containing protein, partial [Tepidisphaeraceae bacterium]|nr:DUF1569 domain-containing protein [Tepidisphaeraceae bacterium]
MQTATPIDTKRVVGRRTLSFATLDEVLADARALAATDRAGRLRPLGNWTVGQTFGHLAAWIDYAYDGYPAPTPWFIRLLGRLMKPRVLKGTPPPGFRIPGVAGGTYATDPLSTDD